MAGLKRKIIYIRPHDPKRTALADYSTAFLEAIRRIDGFEVEDLLGGGSAIDESIDTRTDRDSALLSAERAAQPFMKEQGRGMIIHAEMGNSLHREIWAYRKVRSLLPEAKGVITLHDPPVLCSNPHPYIETQYAGATPIRPLNHALSKTAEVWVEIQRRKIFKALLKQTDVVLALTMSGAMACQSITDFARVQVFNIPHIFSDSLLKVHPDRLESPGTETLHPQIAFYSFLGPQKGIEWLLDAYMRMFERLQTMKNKREPRLLIFGGLPNNSAGAAYGKSLAAKMKELPQEARIRYEPGFVSAEERDRDLSRSHIQVVPFRPIEGVTYCSSGLIRALGLGRPVIATAAGTTREFVEADKNGLLVNPDDVTGLSRAMERLIADAPLRAQLGKAARQQLLTNHSEQIIAERMEKIYTALV